MGFIFVPLSTLVLVIACTASLHAKTPLGEALKDIDVGGVSGQASGDPTPHLQRRGVGAANRLRPVVFILTVGFGGERRGCVR